MGMGAEERVQKRLLRAHEPQTQSEEGTSIFQVMWGGGGVQRGLDKVGRNQIIKGSV